MNFSYVTDPDKIADLIKWHNSNSEYVVLDTETTGTNPRTDRIVHVQMQGRDFNSVVMFDGAHAGLLKNLAVRQVGWNWIGFDWKMLLAAGVDNITNRPVHDAMLIDHLVDENREHNLDSHVQEMFADNYKEQFWAKYENYQDAPLPEQLEYACKDIVYTGHVYRNLLTRARALGVPNSLIDHVHRLGTSLFRTEFAGIRVDLDYCVQMGSSLKEGLERARISAREAAKHEIEVIELETWAEEINKAYKPKGKKWRTLEREEFNFSSSGQVAGLLYGKLRLPPQIHPKSKNVTVDDAALEKLGDAHPVLPLIREIRKLSKMSSAFVDSILEKTENGRIYPRFHVNGTKTGRLSHSDPNMAQMPAKGEWSKVRGIFVPDTGERIVTCDFGMLEVVVAAHYSQDANLLKIIYEGASKHDITAEALGVERQVAKTLNFALQYQCGPKKVADIMKCSQKDGEYYWNKYWETYGGEKAVVDECKARVDRGEPIVNLFGRQRHFPTKFEKVWEKEAAYRQAYSSLIQGTGSDLCSWSLYTTDDRLRSAGLGKTLFTVHDEIVASAVTERAEEAREIIANTMIESGKVAGLSVPLTVDCSKPLDRWEK